MIADLHTGNQKDTGKTGINSTFTQKPDFTNVFSNVGFKIYIAS